MKTCPKCGKSNRDNAKYCKWCGSSLSSQGEGGPFAGLVDKDEIRKALTSIVSKAKAKADFCKKNGIKERMQLSFVITGDVGTGKTTVARSLTSALFAAGIVSAAEPVIINPVEYQNWIKDIDGNVQKLGNKVLIIEEAQKLVPNGPSNGVAQIDYVLQPLRRWREDSTKPVVIFTGQKPLKTFFDQNPDAASAINYFLETGEISVEGLLKISSMLLETKYHRTLTPEASDKLRRIFVNDRRDPSCALGAGGHDAAARANQIDLAALDFGASINTVGEDLVQGKEFVPKTIDEVLAEFDKFVGVEEIKKEISTIARNIQEDVRRGKAPRIENHFQFLGNPGTGKTTMARLFADALNALGALPVGQLVEVSKTELVSSFVGDSTAKVKTQFDKAMGGVLFIDEAYQLGNDSHGKDAVDTILKLAEDNRGKIVVIIAGYTKEMGEFLQLNSGLQSRFDKVINFRDYTPEELTEIFRRRVAGSEYRLSDEASEQVGNFFKKMYLTRTKNFGNAREVRTAFNNALSRVKERLASDPSASPLITMADIVGESSHKAKSVEEILSSLDDFVGMADVKRQLTEIAATVKLNQLRMEMGIAGAKADNLHIAITGNPGTGKTEVAKRLGQILKAMGVLPKGHVVQRERKTLLDSYANSAGANMDKAVDEALGGVLFIDEAYNLIPMDNPSSKDKDGTAAIEALMTRMSNDAGKFVTVIAGYKEPIDEFIANANPGLARRFTHRIHIADYSVPELDEIYLRRAKKENYTLSDEAKDLLYKKIEEMVTCKDGNFGNAGEMNKLFDKTLARQSSRLLSKISSGTLTREEAMTIEASDIPYDAPKKVDLASCLKDLDGLVGLASVKAAVRELADTITVEQQRALASGKRPSVALDHYLFLGNPGTGKTTVARIMGNIFYSLGLLPSNKVLEVKPTDLVAGFVGQTAPKTRQMIDRGLGGVFFIDEAYGLNDGGFGSRDAMPELLTKLIDYKGKMVCIAAGYPYEMAQWLDLNSGLSSRFTRTITFEDYTGEELAQIFRNIVKKNDMKLDDGAEEEMHRYFDLLVFNKGDNFANAREAVNYFNAVKLRQGSRVRKLLDISGYDREELSILRREDMRI